MGTEAKPFIAFDESGNSGGNLLDPEQPVFALASVCLTDQEALDILGRRQGEFKFAKLRRKKFGQDLIVRILDSPGLNSDNCLVSILHKKFMVVAKMIDLLIEPLAHRDGLDLYEQGLNLALANLWYSIFPVIDQGAFEVLLEKFVAMVRKPSQANLHHFYSFVQTLFVQHKEHDFGGELAMLLATYPIADCHRSSWDWSELDPAIPLFVEHAAVWTARFGGEPFSILHDSSKPILHEKRILEAMMSETESRELIGYDRRKMLFPISAGGINFCDSTSVPQVQLADIIAGSIAYCAKALFHDPEDQFALRLRQTKVLSRDVRHFWPSTKVTPEDLGTDKIGGISLADYVAEYLTNRLRGD